MVAKTRRKTGRKTATRRKPATRRKATTQRKTTARRRTTARARKRRAMPLIVGGDGLMMPPAVILPATRRSRSRKSARKRKAKTGLGRLLDAIT